MAAPFKGERVKRWKGEKMAEPFKGERVKKWLRLQTCYLVNSLTCQLVN